MMANTAPVSAEMLSTTTRRSMKSAKAGPPHAGGQLSIFGIAGLLALMWISSPFANDLIRINK
jgi:hypothetical protein